MCNDYARIRPQAMYETKQGTRLKTLTTKQMLQRLPIAFSQVKASNNLESLLIEIRQIVYSLYQSKEITKKCTITQSSPYKYKKNIKNGYHIYELRKQ